MELGIMVCIVLLLSLATVWISNKAIVLLETYYFKRPLSMEYAAWLRVICAGLLLVFIQLAPQVTLLYTLKLVALINFGVQTMKLNGVYKFKRVGIMPTKDTRTDLSRFNPFRRK
ncbi:hypothetical protein QPK13_22740 [Photorhabdus tasmaniensis]